MSAPTQPIKPDATAAGPSGLGSDAVVAGRYQLQRQLGNGGAAAVFAARDRVLGRPVAVKVCREDGSDEQRSRFEQEARVMAGLNHPGLVTVYDAGADEPAGQPQHPYLVMELVDGASLAEILRSGPLPPAHAASVGCQIASALAYVHGRGIVHRDVKPANILLSRRGDADEPIARLTDFGVARTVDGDRLTVTGMTVGTANYFSPEQARGADVEPASDVYALGLVLIECLTATVAFPGAGIPAAAARLHQPAPIPAWPGPAWVALLSAMTDVDPQRRPAASQVAAELSRLRRADGLTQTRVMPAVVVAPGASQRRRRWMFAVVGVAGVLTALGIALAAGQSGDSDGATRPPVSPAAHPTSPIAAPSTAPITAAHTTPPSTPAAHAKHHGGNGGGSGGGNGGGPGGGGDGGGPGGGAGG